jgi:hypothetical protein
MLPALLQPSAPRLDDQICLRAAAYRQLFGSAIATTDFQRCPISALLRRLFYRSLEVDCLRGANENA